MPYQEEALAALASALSHTKPCFRKIEEAWGKALEQAAGTKYERHLVELAIALDLGNREAVLQGVQGILDGFGA